MTDPTPEHPIRIPPVNFVFADDRTAFGEQRHIELIAELGLRLDPESAVPDLYCASIVIDAAGSAAWLDPNYPNASDMPAAALTAIAAWAESRGLSFHPERPQTPKNTS
jgi:hypothetical protein